MQDSATCLTLRSSFARHAVTDPGTP